MPEHPNIAVNFGSKISIFQAVCNSDYQSEPKGARDLQLYKSDK